MREIVGRDGFVLLDEPRRGSYAARKTAIRSSDSDVFAFTDADCRPDPGWLLAAVGVLDAGSSVAAVAGRVDMDFPDGTPSTSCDWWEALEAFPQEGYVVGGFGVTANLVVRADVVRALDGFDDDAVSGGDVDFGRRLRAAGHRLVYAPEVVVLHPPRSTWSQLLGKTRRTTRGVSRLNHLRGRTNRELVVDLRTQWLNLLRSVKKAARSPALPTPTARLHYLVAALAVHTVIIAETTYAELTHHVPRRAH